MEIERKWMVKGWPEESLGLTLLTSHEMEQGYLSTAPTVRLRKEAEDGGDTEYILCFKSSGGLVREEIELPLPEATFADIAKKILVKPMIPKTRRSYALPGGLVLEVNEVDKGAPTAFYYAEIEFPRVPMALGWQPDSDALAAYLRCEVTHEKGQSMAEYWAVTREGATPVKIELD